MKSNEPSKKQSAASLSLLLGFIISLLLICSIKDNNIVNKFVIQELIQLLFGGEWRELERVS